jgi:hypothetical protein
VFWLLRSKYLLFYFVSTQRWLILRYRRFVAVCPSNLKGQTVKLKVGNLLWYDAIVNEVHCVLWRRFSIIRSKSCNYNIICFLCPTLWDFVCRWIMYITMESVWNTVCLWKITQHFYGLIFGGYLRLITKTKHTYRYSVFLKKYKNSLHICEIQII